MHKSILTIFCFLCAVFSLSAQEISAPIVLPAQPDSTYRYYAELLGVGTNFLNLNKNVNVQVDLGQSSSRMKSQMLLDEEGKAIKFNSMVAAMNYMGQRGWKFIQAYVVTTGNQNVYHWLMYKDVHNNRELLEGINIKDVDEDIEFETNKNKKKEKKPKEDKPKDPYYDELYGR